MTGQAHESLSAALQRRIARLRASVLGSTGMSRANMRIAAKIFLVAAALSMAACRPGSRERAQSEPPDSMKMPANEIPAAAAAVLEHADHFELLSLDPHLQIDRAKNQVDGYKVLGSAVISDPETRRKLVSAFEKAVAENDGVMAACFNPRHEIRVTQGKKHVNFVICFECDQVQLGGDVSGEFLITNSAEPLFNSVLRSNGVPRAAP